MNITGKKRSSTSILMLLLWLNDKPSVTSIASTGSFYFYFIECIVIVVVFPHFYWFFMIFCYIRVDFYFYDCLQTPPNFLATLLSCASLYFASLSFKLQSSTNLKTIFPRSLSFSNSLSHSFLSHILHLLFWMVNRLAFAFHATWIFMKAISCVFFFTDSYIPQFFTYFLQFCWRNENRWW